MGCEVSSDIGAIAAADVVYVLRMQRERMLPGAAYVPSLREYAAEWGVTPGRLRPRAGRHAPGPDEPRRRDRPPRRRLGRLADHRAGARPGLVVRMAVLYDLLAGGARVDRSAPAAGGRSDALLARGARATASRSAARASIDPARGARRRRSTSRSRTASSRRSSRPPRPPGGSCSRPPSSTRTSTSACPGREDEETIASGTAAAAAGGYCAILAMPNTDPGRRLGRRARRADRAGAGGGGDPDRLHGVDLEGPAWRGADRDGRARAARRGRRSRTTASPVVVGRPDAAGALSTAASRAGSSPSTRRSRRSRATGRCTTAPVSAELGLAGWPSVAESVMIERDCALAAYEQRSLLHIMHLSARESVAAVRAAQARRGRGQRGGLAPPSLPDRRQPCAPSTPTGR